MKITTHTTFQAVAEFMGSNATELDAQLFLSWLFAEMAFDPDETGEEQIVCDTDDIEASEILYGIKRAIAEREEIDATDYSGLY